MRKQKGFSLIELLIVVGIIGALTAIAVPTYQALQEKSEVVAGIGTLKNLRSVIDSDIIDSKGFISDANLTANYGIDTEVKATPDATNKNAGKIETSKVNIFIAQYSRTNAGTWTCNYNATSFADPVGSCTKLSTLTIP
ncbi:hypothetical protein A1OO_01840 [Enterovibrio norvegicus FF-33]|uniref:prepilin-type N-terminal cleavage/methylation domain-containing protein n=1 Tax=Enterovibrio norvegicus TaxID=188144 RepID=UPI000366CD84|nr:prepilin-type N-terminal cleavage/methylation domain-containing protein [Enterovibrio norvegicus]OEE70538.1 hypothetical protein A1OO_01840 [Enterovibrio norvegicus FF-33]